MAQVLIIIDIQEGLVKLNPYNAKNFISIQKQSFNILESKI